MSGYPVPAAGSRPLAGPAACRRGWIAGPAGSGTAAASGIGAPRTPRRVLTFRHQLALDPDHFSLTTAKGLDTRTQDRQLLFAANPLRRSANRPHDGSVCPTTASG